MITIKTQNNHILILNNVTIDNTNIYGTDIHGNNYTIPYTNIYTGKITII